MELTSRLAEDQRLVGDRFFEDHLARVRARLEAQMARALERQRVARRDLLHRQALLEGKDFQLTERD